MYIVMGFVRITVLRTTAPVATAARLMLLWLLLLWLLLLRPLLPWILLHCGCYRGCFSLGFCSYGCSSRSCYTLRSFYVTAAPVAATADNHMVSAAEANPHVAASPPFSAAPVVAATPEQLLPWLLLLWRPLLPLPWLLHPYR